MIELQCMILWGKKGGFALSSGENFVNGEIGKTLNICLDVVKGC